MFRIVKIVLFLSQVLLWTPQANPMLQRLRTVFSSSPQEEAFSLKTVLVPSGGYGLGDVDESSVPSGVAADDEVVVIGSLDLVSPGHFFHEVPGSFGPASEEEEGDGLSAFSGQTGRSGAEEPAVMVMADAEGCFVVHGDQSPSSRRRIAQAVSSVISQATGRAVVVAPLVAAAGGRAITAATAAAVPAAVQASRRALSAGMSASDAAGELLGVAHAGDGLGLPRAAWRFAVTASGVTITVATKVGTVIVRAAVVITPIVAREIANVVSQELAKS